MLLKAVVFVEYSFKKIEDPIALLNNVKKGKISLEEAKEKQKNYYNYLNMIQRGNENASQKRTLTNINIFFNARDNAIKFIEDYRGKKTGKRARRNRT